MPFLGYLSYNDFLVMSVEGMNHAIEKRIQRIQTEKMTQEEKKELYAALVAQSRLLINIDKRLKIIETMLKKSIWE